MQPLYSSDNLALNAGVECDLVARRHSVTVVVALLLRTASLRFTLRARRITSKSLNYYWDTAPPLKPPPRY